MQAEPILLIIFGIALAIVLIGSLLRLFKQPQVVTYILSGILLGPSVFALITDQDSLLSIGSIGIILLMFFVGMEVSLPRLVSNWKIAIIGTILQVILSVLAMLFFGKFLGWSFATSVLIGFVISVSSTAVIIKVLKEWKELHTKIGQDVLGILIVQDILIAPMIIIIGMMNSNDNDIFLTIKSIITGIMIIGAVIWAIKKDHLNLPFEKQIRDDPEIYIFMSLILAFGFAILTSIFGLSSALGAFIAGLLVSEGENSAQIKKTLEPFYFVFVAIFFVSIGMLLDIELVTSNIVMISILVLIIFALSTAINMLTLKFLGSTWRESFYAGAILSQTGEFGFVLASVGVTSGILSKDSQGLIFALISLTLILSPFWIRFVKKIMRIKEEDLMIPAKLTMRKFKDIYSTNISVIASMCKGIEKRIRNKKNIESKINKVADACKDIEKKIIDD